MKAEPKILSASVRFAGGKAAAVLELELDPRDAVGLARSISEDDARIAPILELANALEAEAKALAESEVPRAPAPVEE